MQKLKLPLFSRRLKLSLIGIALVVIACSALVWSATINNTGKDLTNSGTILPSGGAATSPLLMVRDDSVQKAISQGNNESALVEISNIAWGNVYTASDSFAALGTCIDVYNNDSSVTIYPSWSVKGLPTGCTLTAYVAVLPYLDPSTGKMVCSAGVEWAENDATAFYLPPKDMATTSLDKINFVLTLTGKYSAIPQTLRFRITFAFTIAD